MAVNQKIVSGIVNKIGNDRASAWYVGIATDPKTRLFRNHNVDEKHGRWIFYYAGSEADARDTERCLLERYGFRGGTGGGENPRFVYAYKITAATRQ